jgi:hypothetical protein
MLDNDAEWPEAALDLKRSSISMLDNDAEWPEAALD